MKNLSKLNKIVLLLTGIFAGYEIVSGIDGNPFPVIISLTISFGALLLTCLLLILLGFEILENPIVAIFATILPLGFSSAVIALVYPLLLTPYISIGLVGFLTIIISRFLATRKVAIIILSLVHSITGLVIVVIPIFSLLNGFNQSQFILVSLGGALIGVGGVLLFLLKTEHAILSKQQIYFLLPAILLLMTISFIVGFSNSI